VSQKRKLELAPTRQLGRCSMKTRRTNYSYMLVARQPKGQRTEIGVQGIRVSSLERSVKGRSPGWRGLLRVVLRLCANQRAAKIDVC
jgi:hypothetical protein